MSGKLHILIADNKYEMRKGCAEAMDTARFMLHFAETPTEARRVLDQGGIDVAVIDIRLIDDDDEGDTSGLDLTYDERYAALPKIIFTVIDEKEVSSSELFRPYGGALPPNARLMRKHRVAEELSDAATDISQRSRRVDIPSTAEAVAEAVQDVAGRYPALREAREATEKAIDSYYARVQRKAEIAFWVAIAIALAGFVLTAVAVVLIVRHNYVAASAAGVAGAIQASVGSWLAWSNETGRTFHDTYLLSTLSQYRFEASVRACDLLPEQQRLATLEAVIRRANEHWFPTEYDIQRRRHGHVWIRRGRAHG